MAPARVVLTGPECTGKTTLASQLAARFGGTEVPEAARRYVERVSPVLSLATVEPIARLWLEQAERAGTAARAAAQQSVLVFDTDLVSTVVYSKHYYGTCAEWIEREAAARRADLYLLCYPDLPWVADGVRDRPAGREALFADFETALLGIGARIAIIRGEGPLRLDRAVSAVESMLRERRSPV